MAEKVTTAKLVEKIIYYLQTSWLYILDKIGGREAAALAIPVTLSMLIIGVLTYFLLRYIVLRPLFERAGLGEESPAVKWTVLLITISITFISLYSGIALVMAVVIQGMGIIYAGIALLFLFFLLTFTTWRWGKHTFQTIKEYFPIRRKEERMISEEVKETEEIEREEEEIEKEITEFIGEDVREIKFYRWLKENLDTALSPRYINSTINWLKRIKNWKLTHQKKLKSESSKFFKDIDRIIKTLKKNEKIVREALSYARRTRRDISSLRYLERIINNLEKINEDVEKKKKEFHLLIEERDRNLDILLNELIKIKRGKRVPGEVIKIINNLLRKSMESYKKIGKILGEIRKIHMEQKKAEDQLEYAKGGLERL